MSIQGKEQKSSLSHDLKVKHPYKPAPSLPHIPIDHHQLTASLVVVLDMIKSFPYGTSCGQDELRTQHLLNCLHGVVVDNYDELVSSITQVGIMKRGGYTSCHNRLIEDREYDAQHFFDAALYFALEHIVTASGPRFGKMAMEACHLTLRIRGLEISVGKEVDIRLSDRVDKPLHLADMLLYSWDGDLNVRVDLTGSSPLIDATQRKCVKYEANLFKDFAKDIYGDHVVSYAGIIGIKHRHNVGRDKPLRPSDILLYSWDGGLDVCVDLTGSSPLTQTKIVDFVPGQVVIDAAQHKHGLSGCQDGGDNGLTKTSLITHLRDWHCSGEAQAITKHSLLTNVIVF
nr:auxilin-like protein [Tanacetum cinerariifolium]